MAATGPKVVDAAPAADAAHDTGSWIPAVVTGVLGLLIGAAAVFAAKRRRRTE
ncbi:LPXTG cell wall anchor domain-containing protein [Streptomyces venezuelae]|nr:LPXTG cell wall anchor domain-containing protein [Streptomyces venezuelae]